MFPPSRPRKRLIIRILQLVSVVGFQICVISALKRNTTSLKKRKNIGAIKSLLMCRVVIMSFRRK